MAEVESYCTHCGAKIEPHARFCPGCGRAIPLAAAPASTSATPKSRPTGVTLIAILNIIAGTSMFFLVFVAAVGSGASPSPDDEGLAAVTIVLSIPIGTLYFVLAYGLLKARPWAWTGTVVLSIITIVLNVIFIASLSILSIINIIIDVIILYYLYRPHVKIYFGKALSSSRRQSEVH